MLAALFAALTAVGAYIKIPLPFVPITLQTFFVMLSGTVLGPRFGAMSQFMYLVIGLAGVPVFTHGGGPAYVLQPTFGYLLSYPAAAYIIGTLTHQQNLLATSYLRIYFASAVGMLLILTLGAGVLYLNFKFVLNKPISFGTLFIAYFLVFIPGDLIKIALSALTSKKLYRVLSLSTIRS